MSFILIDNFTIMDASKHGHVDPSDQNNFAIRYTSKNGHSEVVKLLLNDLRVDSSAPYKFAFNSIRQIV